jgi:hypothetical protein
MRKELPQPSAARLAAAASKYLVPAAQSEPVKQEKRRMIPHMDDFPPGVQEVVYEIIAKALIRHAKELEERKEGTQ